MSASNEGSEDVDQFLARIASLSKKDNGDAEQARRAEEQMMQAKKERQARRAERARSISPNKTGPAAPLSSPSTPSHERSIEPPVSLTPRSRAQTLRRPDESPTRSSRPLPSPSPERETQPARSSREGQAPPSFPSTNATSLSRSGTLSWQQRPTSRGIGSVRSRPLSASRGTSVEPPSSPASAAEKDAGDPPSRKDIAAALGSKDPAWFRQTQDRGIGSAAYRKSDQDDSAPSMRSRQGMKLPGLSSEIDASRSAQRMPPPASPHGVDDGETLAKRSSGSQSPRRHHAAAYVSNPGPVPSLSPAEHTPALSPATGDRSSQELESGLARNASVLSSAGRPPSPTKGLGGFVQSAMMRRSDSVSKRWSVQANAGLKRGDSVAGNRPAYNLPAPNAPSLGHARTFSREPRAGRDGTSSPQSGSRPTSSHAEEDSNQSALQKSRSEPHDLATTSNKDFVAAQAPGTEAQDESLLARSPSKTMDPRRWSPTKASWLESALSRPESPRPSPTKEEPPPWMVGLQRSKSQKDLGDAEKKPSSFEPVSTGGLLRSPAPGSRPKPLDISSKPTNGTKPASDTPGVAKPSDQENESATETANPPESHTQTSTTQPASDAPAPVAISRSTQDQKPSSTDRPDFRSSVDKKAPLLKPKPQTPPKTDFRANLKSRQTGATNANADEPEFKSMFGKLKKAETKNYVAPDTLKNNITQGKAALNLTGGPQPRKRVDEFKESILAQKEAMKAGGGSIHKKAESKDTSPEKPEADVPEALRRRNTLHKSKASVDKAAATDLPQARTTHVDSTNKNPALVTEAKQEKVAPRPAPKPLEKPKDKPEPLTEKSAAETPQSRLVTMPSKGSTSTTIPLQQSESSETKKGLLKESDSTLSRTTTETSDTSSRDVPVSGRGSPAIGVTPQLKKSAGGGLAARLNPALAGLIARGNSPRPTGDNASDEHLPLDSTQRSTGPAAKAEDPANLSHMTKGRAKGPKRRAPKSEATPAQTEAPKVQSSATVLPARAKVEPAAPKSPERSPVKASFADARKAFDAKPAVLKAETPQTEQTPLSSVRDSQPEAKSPAMNSKSPELKRVSNQSPSLPEKPTSPPAVASKSPKVRRISSQSPAQVEKTEPAPPKSPPKKAFDIATDGTKGDSSALTPAATMPLTPSRSKLNSPRPQKASDGAADSPLAAKTKSPGLGLQMTPATTTPVKPRELTPPPEKDLNVSAPVESRKAAANASPARQALETFFTAVPRSEDKADFDTEAILNSSLPAPDRVKTLNCQSFEVTGDGKKTAPSPGQEHVLYEDCMYLVIHTLELNGKKATEAYLWTGDAVSSSAVDDAQLFCRKVARENSAKLDVVKQGKESSNFFSALGGILIIRRSKSSALYMIRGQRHVGHVAFDEVDLSPESLCSGFAYLISAKFGKLYLWKGQGCGADEIGAARLIGMDIGLTGEIEEVAEGKEPAAFWECFPIANAKAVFKASDIWAMRSMDEKKGFPCKLYRLESERPKSSGGGFWGLRAATSPAKGSNKATLTEIAPFTQQDLEKESVYVLDAWASIYVIPGTQCKPAEFATACLIAQELAVLTPSMQDRALLPSCEVVFGALPREVRAAFRKFVPLPSEKNQTEGKLFEVAEVLGALD